MKKFIQWAEDNRIELPVYPQNNKTNENSSSKKRSGISHWSFDKEDSSKHLPNQKTN